MWVMLGYGRMIRQMNSESLRHDLFPLPHKASTSLLTGTRAIFVGTKIRCSGRVESKYNTVTATNARLKEREPCTLD